MAVDLNEQHESVDLKELKELIRVLLEQLRHPMSGPKGLLAVMMIHQVLLSSFGDNDGWFLGDDHFKAEIYSAEVTPRSDLMDATTADCAGCA
jgi:hypothetical protein